MDSRPDRGDLIARGGLASTSHSGLKLAYWRLEKPIGATPVVVANLTAGLRQDRQFEVRERPSYWLLKRDLPPPVFLRQLPLRLTRQGAIAGSPLSLQTELANWPNNFPIGGFAAPKALEELEAVSTEPSDGYAWIKIARICRDALGGTVPPSLPNVAVRVAQSLFRWFPDGQMLFWVKNQRYMAVNRLMHVLGSAQLLDAPSVLEGLTGGSGNSFWIAGEDIVPSHPGPMFLDILPIGTGGFCFDTVPLIFLFEFGRPMDWEELDVLATTHLHSLGLLRYFGAGFPAGQPVIKPSALAVDSLRSWFLCGMNGLADALVRLENFHDANRWLRPYIQVQANMTVGRILDTTAHLLAIRDHYGRQLALWDLLDLYAGLLGPPGQPVRINQLLDRPFWRKFVLTALGTIPGSVSVDMTNNAKKVYEQWTSELTEGLVQQSHLLKRSVRVGPRRLKKPRAEFFARHIAARRNTLHGYHPRNPNQFRDYLAVHDGRLPPTLYEWGRFAFLSILGSPAKFLRHYRNLT